MRREPAELSWTWQVRLISHTFYTPTVSFFINTAIFALWVTFCVCVRKSNQLLPVRLFQGLKRTLLFVILDSVKFILILRHCSCKKEKRKAPYCCRNLFFMSSGFIKMSSALCLTAAAERWLCNFCFLLLYNVLLLGRFLSQRKIKDKDELQICIVESGMKCLNMYMCVFLLFWSFWKCHIKLKAVVLVGFKIIVWQFINPYDFPNWCGSFSHLEW